MPVHQIEHPLATHYLTLLRDAATTADAYRSYSYKACQILIVEACRSLRTKPVDVQTPLERTTGALIDANIVCVPILRAGLSMLQPALDLLPNASVGYMGMERDEDTAIASMYYCKLPKIDAQDVFVLDPMIATSGTATSAIAQLQSRGANSLSMLSLLASPEGIEKLHEAFPKLSIYTIAIDRELDANKYIRPGLGDFGDRLNHTL